MNISLKICLVFLLVCTLVSANKKVTVHMVTHSHNDAGWLKPFEEYFKCCTNKTLTTVVDALIKDSASDNPKNYTFHWSDMAFFYRWWQDQSTSIRNDVKKLVREGKFIFINGGWVINDEALPSYKESMAQMRLGLDFIQKEFGTRPHIGWQIDPFGSTGLTASVLKKLGFTAFIENRISNDFKKVLKDKEGYNFCWEGHQVDENKEDDRILTYILQYFYTLPGLRLDSGFIGTNKKAYAQQFWDYKIQTVIDSLNNVSGGTVPEYHIMAASGDDFAFQSGHQVFKAFDDLITELENLGTNKGYDIEIKYSSLYQYFEDFKSLNLDLGVFKGDFMPFQETWPGWDWNDFWTGYYSTRLHMKRWIRHTFNNLESIKAYLTIKAVQGNKGSVNFKSTTQASIDQINEVINEAEKRWAIMMHHDAITGTHTAVTEKDYYNILKQSNEFLTKAYSLINDNLGLEAERSIHDQLKAAVDKLGSNTFDHYTVVNPTADRRSEVINVTLTSSLEVDDTYAVFLHYLNGNNDTLFKNVHSSYADIQDMDTSSHELQTVRKLFVHIEMPAFSDIHMYIIPCKKGSFECSDKEHINTLSTKSEPLTSKTHRMIRNPAIQLEIGKDGKLRSINNFRRKIKSNLSERFTAFDTRKSRSGLYLFNPRSAQIEVKTNLTSIWYYELPNLKSIIQVEHGGGATRFLKTYSIDQVGLDENLEQFFLEVHSFTSEVWEVSFGIKKDKQAKDSEFKTFIDDSMKLVERPIFDKNLDIQHIRPEELYGYYTSPCVNGGMLSETVKKQDVDEIHQLSWANSNPIGCTLSSQNQIDFMVFRNIGSNDLKGVDETPIDSHATYNSFIFRLDMNDGAYRRNFAGSILNSPLFIYEDLEVSPAANKRLTAPGAILDDIFSTSSIPHLLHGSIDVVDIKLVRHTILNIYNDYEIAMVLRNRFNGYLPLNKTSKHKGEGLFKNKFIDTMKSSNKDTNEFKCNDSKTILKEHRYDIETCEYIIQNSKPSDFHGLEPYELAEFRLVKSSTLEALNMKQQGLNSAS
ncbi:unnamed protein product [Moneuplotes crassus]|uniref:Glycoside hydrolase family 38 central domain-containing protein n=1 Tax=Euplotes crassus TaxID=5936 RepID=A0AAD1XT22_EUPCR|nr:unnamed protein product [Moneuplotes crassus]